MMELKDHIIQKLLDDIREKTLETAVLKARLTLTEEELQKTLSDKQKLEEIITQTGKEEIEEANHE